MSGAQSRLAAGELLVLTLDERRTLDEALAASAAYDRLTGADRGFARAMASAAIRQLGRIDAGLAPFLDRPLETATPPARALLRVGAAQAWLLETPDHAVVGETVSAAKMWPRAQRAAGFLNAVLRKVVADRSAFDAAPALGTWPVWLKTLMVDGVGVSAATRLAEAQSLQPAIYLTPRNGDAAALAARLDAEAVGTHSVRVEGQAIDALPGYDSGDWWVQDIAASLPARLLAAQPGEQVLDICAAPGGKTMQLAATGAKVTAIDRSRPRLRRLKENLKRTGFGDVGIVEADATSWQPRHPVDAILLDAPCSALGTLRRHPEGAWIKSAGDIARFPAFQQRLLRAALAMLKPGGRLVYCVCSPLPMEGRDVVQAVLGDTDAQRLPVTVEEAGIFAGSVTDEGDVLTLPTDAFEHDAFFIARLTRT